MPDVTKLPKWAQQRISKLEHDVDYWKRQATAGPEESDTFIRRFAEGLDKPLGVGVHVAFIATKGATYHGSLGVEVGRLQDGAISVRTIGGGRLAFLPSASNSGYLLHLER